MTRKAAEILDPGFDLEIVEMHHRFLKSDAPSGTAATLAEVLAGVRKQQLDRVIRHGRRGASSAQGVAAEEVGMQCVARKATLWEITPSSSPRTANNVEFDPQARRVAKPLPTIALRAAAQWAVKQRPGLYDMQDVLGLK